MFPFTDELVNFRTQEDRTVLNYERGDTGIKVYEGNTALTYKPNSTALQNFKSTYLPAGSWAVEDISAGDTGLTTTNITVPYTLDIDPDEAGNQSPVSNIQAQIQPNADGTSANVPWAGLNYSDMQGDDASVVATIKITTKKGELVT